MAREPYFPPELQRKVFETTASMHPTTISALLRVAKRVVIWWVFIPLWRGRMAGVWKPIHTLVSALSSCDFYF
jgi:hypothetical protein